MTSGKLTSRKRGWCPSLYEPMQTGDGLLVRVKPPGATLSPGAARALAQAATRHGNGIIELTQRGNLQVRGLRPDTTAPFAQVMRDAGLAGTPERESRRPVMPPPLLGADPTLAADAGALTAGLEHAFATDPRLADLPAKFAIAIDAGGVFAAFPVAADLVAWTDGRSRGLRPAPAGDTPTPAGFIPYPGAGAGAFAAAPPFGQLDAALLEHIADSAAQYGTTIRVSPWRALLLARVPDADAGALAASLGTGFITDPADPRLLVTACIGAPGCGSGTVPARADAAQLRPKQRVHVSGCPKGCAHPGPAPFTLVGDEGRYHLVRDGRASDTPAAPGLSFPAVLSLAGLTP